MRAIHATDLGSDLAGNLERVVADRDPLIVTRSAGEAVVILSASDFASHMESVGLLSDPEDAARTRKALAEAAAGEFTRRELIREWTRDPTTA